MKHVMVDLETMGTVPGCPIMSIGAVAFDPVKGTLGSQFYDVVDLQSCMNAGLRLDASTILWWMKQSDEARAALTDREGAALPIALSRFAEWFSKSGGQFFWSHGASFDEPILQVAARVAKVTMPWKFWDVRDTRTLFDLAGVTVGRGKGTHHNALDDAQAQALTAIEAYAKLGVGMLG